MTADITRAAPFGSIAGKPAGCCNAGLTSFFTENLWPGLLLWILLYISDYSLTIRCARLYRERAKDKLVFEGSYEITPYYQRDVNMLRRFSPRFMVALCVITAFLAVLWLFAPAVEFYEFFLGVMILAEFAIHIRHIRNLVMFQTGFGEDGARGRIEYPRRVTLHLSATELWAFACLFLIRAGLVGSVFLLGGGFGCAAVARKHRAYAKAQVTAGPTGTPTSSTPVRPEESRTE